MCARTCVVANVASIGMLLVDTPITHMDLESAAILVHAQGDPLAAMALVDIRFLFLSGETAGSLQAEPSWTVSHLKAAIRKTLPSQMRLSGIVFQSASLEEEHQTIEELGICSEGELNLVVRKALWQPGTYSACYHRQSREYETSVLYTVSIADDATFVLARYFEVGGCGGMDDILQSVLR